MSEEFQCPDCHKSFKTNAGRWKHSKSKHGVAVETQAELESSSPNHSRSLADLDGATEIPDPASSQETIWNKWSIPNDDDSNSSIPLPLKLVAKTGKIAAGAKLSKVQQKAVDEKAIALLKLTLTGADFCIGHYGRTITLDNTYSCRHSDSEKTLVAEAQLEAFKDKNIQVTSILSPTTVALALTAGYVFPPIVALQRNKKRKMLKGGGRRMLSWIPIIGKRFKPKPTDFFEQLVEDSE
jgi:hypothetical protein